VEVKVLIFINKLNKSLKGMHEALVKVEIEKLGRGVSIRKVCVKIMLLTIILQVAISHWRLHLVKLIYTQAAKETDRAS